MKVKMNYNSWAEALVEIVDNSKSRVAKEKGKFVFYGVGILNSYMKQIVNRAIQIDDPVILEACINLGIARCDTQEEEDEIVRRAKEQQDNY